MSSVGVWGIETERAGNEHCNENTLAMSVVPEALQDS